MSGAVLRGGPTSGSGEAALARLVEGAALAECAVAVAAVERGRPGRYDAWWDAFFATGRGVSPALRDRLEGACGAALREVLSVVQHDDVCSPWRPGVRADPGTQGAVLDLSTARVLLGRTGYDPKAALQEVREALDWIRFQQDVLRGGGDRAWAAQAVQQLRTLQGPWIRWLLERGDLDGDALSEVVDALGLLLDTEPSPGTLVAAVTYRLFVQEWQPRLHGLFWIPPGGWDPGHPQRWHWDNGSAHVGEDSEKAILLLALEQHLEALGVACPEGARRGDCLRGLYELVSGDHGAGEGGVSRLRRAVLGTDPEGVFLEWFVDITLGEMNRQAWSLVLDVEGLSFRSLRLAQLRLHAAFLRTWRRTGRCPSEGELDAAAWGPLLEDPVFGGALDLSHGLGDHWVIRPRGRFSDVRIDAWGPDYVFSCPPGSGSDPVSDADSRTVGR